MLIFIFFTDVRKAALSLLKHNSRHNRKQTFSICMPLAKTTSWIKYLFYLDTSVDMMGVINCSAKNAIPWCF